MHILFTFATNIPDLTAFITFDRVSHAEILEGVDVSCISVMISGGAVSNANFGG